MNQKSALNKTIRIAWIFVFILIGSSAITVADAASVILSWNANDPAPEGYRVFARRGDQAYNYSRPAWQGSTIRATINNLEEHTEYYFVVRAYQGYQESANSNEVRYVTPATENSTSTPPNSTGSDTTPPYWDGATSGIGSVLAEPSGGQVTIEFDTARDAVDGSNLKFNVYYSPSSAWDNGDWTGNSVVAQATVRQGEAFAHAVIVNGLTNGVRYTFGVRVEDRSGNEDSNTTTLRATPHSEMAQSPSLGYLNGAAAEPVSAIDLSSEGSRDWAHWGLLNPSSFNRKSNGGQQISNFKPLKSQVGRFGDARTNFWWSGGTPTAGVSGTTAGVYFPGVGNGCELRVPAGTSAQTLRLYLGGWGSKGRLEAALSDGSAAPYVAYFANANGIFDRVVTLNFAAASEGQELRIQYRMEPDFPNGNITLIAASLSVEGTPSETTPATSPSPNPNYGSVEATVAEPVSAVDLAFEGSRDWVHWGLVNPSSVNRKSSGGQQIRNFKPLKSQVGRFGDARTNFWWSGGTPAASVSGTTTGLYFSGAGNGYELSVAAGTSPRTLRLYLGGWGSKGRLEVSLSDGSAAPYVAYFANANGTFDRVVTLNFSAASEGQELRIQYRMEPDFPNGNITLIAASLEDARSF